MINSKIFRIIREMPDIQRRGQRKVGERVMRYHHENDIRRTIKDVLLNHNILMDIKETEVMIVSSNSVSAGSRVYNTMHVKVIVKIILTDMDDQDQAFYTAGAAASGDDFSNASSAAITYAIRDWMKAKFQITYPETDEDDVESAPAMVLSEDIAEECKLTVSRNIKLVKEKAKAIGFNPGNWNVSKMSHEDLFRCSIMVLHAENSTQSGIMSKVADKIKKEAEDE